jgi:hypothetical protein
MKRPNDEALHLAPKLSRFDSELRSLPVNLGGTASYLIALDHFRAS